MKKSAIYLALTLPVIGLGLAALFPQADPPLAAPLFHFYVVTFTTFAATVVSLFVTISVGETALPRHLLLAIAFAWMGAVFFIHGVTTPGAVIESFHPALTWSAWLTLFGGGGLFLVGAFAPNTPQPRFLRAAAAVIFIGYLLYVALAAFAPGALAQLLQLRTPPVDALVFGLTMTIWLASGAKHYLNYRRTRNAFDGLMAFESVWYAAATASMFRYPVWNASWWMYHALLLTGFLIAIYFLWRSYEQVRAFRLSRYFAAASLIVTAALALLSAQLYSQLVYRNVLEQLSGALEIISQDLADELAAELSTVKTGDDLQRTSAAAQVRAALRERIARLQIASATLYDAEGVSVFSTEEAQIGLDLSALPSFQVYEEALAGEGIVEIHAPGEAPPAYQPDRPIHLLEAYVPFRPGGEAAAAPIGVLVTIREAPSLGQALILSRRSGIGLAALSLGGLFLALLAIVRRADRIITSRSRELEQAYANLRQAEGLRDDLTSMIVHDLRNPLMAITANLDLIAKAIKNPALTEAPLRFLANARASGQRMTGMMDDLLNVSKIEAGELRPETLPLSLSTLLAEKEPGYRSQAERDRKTMTISAPPELPAVRGDAEMIGRVLDNLVSNALKYTDLGGHIEITVEHADRALLVQVRDDGEGIPPEYHTRIFDKFVQVADPTGKPMRKGTGLGLAFCRLAVEAHRGKIWVESAPGTGSTFFFTLPLP